MSQQFRPGDEDLNICHDLNQVACNMKKSKKSHLCYLPALKYLNPAFLAYIHVDLCRSVKSRSHGLLCMQFVPIACYSVMIHHIPTTTSA
jgi:hypothetical protein